MFSAQAFLGCVVHELGLLTAIQIRNINSCLDCSVFHSVYPFVARGTRGRNKDDKH